MGTTLVPESKLKSTQALFRETQSFRHPPELRKKIWGAPLNLKPRLNITYAVTVSRIFSRTLAAAGTIVHYYIRLSICTILS